MLTRCILFAAALSAVATDLAFAQANPSQYVLGVYGAIVRVNDSRNPAWKYGFKISKVDADSPAELYGLKPGDIITTAGFKVVKKLDDLRKGIDEFTTQPAYVEKPQVPLNYIDGATWTAKNVRVYFNSATPVENK